jgi:hypothetical protein
MATKIFFSDLELSRLIMDHIYGFGRIVGTTMRLFENSILLLYYIVRHKNDDIASVMATSPPNMIFK